MICNTLFFFLPFILRENNCPPSNFMLLRKNLILGFCFGRITLFHTLFFSDATNSTYIYFTNGTNLCRLPLNTSNGHVINGIEPELINMGTEIFSIEIDFQNDNIYWSDLRAKHIRKSNLDGSHLNFLITYGIGEVYGLAIDWTSNVLYWTDYTMKRIEVSQVDGKYRKVLFQFESNQYPILIATDPVNG